MLLPPCYARVAGPCTLPLPSTSLIYITVILSEYYHYYRHYHPLIVIPHQLYFVPPHCYRMYTRARTLSSTIDVNVRATIVSSLIVPGCNCKANSPYATTWLTDRLPTLSSFLDSFFSLIRCTYER